MLNANQEEIEKEIIHRSKFRDLHKANDTIFPYLIEHLDRIDNKVSALLTFDGIGVAILTLLGTSSPFLKEELYLELFTISLSGLFMIASCYICLTMIYLYGYHSSDGIDAKEYERKIVSAVVLRTKRYNVALRLNHIASILFMVFITIVIIRFIINQFAWLS